MNSWRELVTKNYQQIVEIQLFACLKKQNSKQWGSISVGTKFTLMRIIIIYISVKNNSLLEIEKEFPVICVNGLGMGNDCCD